MDHQDRRAGAAAVLGAVVAISANAVVLRADPAVANDRVSYPLSATAFARGQVLFALTQGLFTFGVLGLARSQAVAFTRRTTFLGLLAVGGFVLTVVGELALIPVASSNIESAGVAAASTVFGLGSLLSDVGLIGIGILAIRQRRWHRGWAALPLIAGVFQIVAVTPVILSQGFASIASFAAISFFDLLVALIGIALLCSQSEQVPQRPLSPRVAE